jgi:hypothetical protein
MPIKVSCKCGRSLTAPDDAIGKHGKCPGCGGRLLIAEPELVLLEEAPQDPVGVKIDLGRVSCRFSSLYFSFEVDTNGCAFVQVIAYCDYDDGSETSVVGLRLDDRRYEDLLNAVEAVKATVAKYKAAGRGRRLVEVFG